METLQDLVNLLKDRERLCLIGDDEYSSRQAYNAIINLAKGFLESDLKPGDRVMLVSRNRPEWMIIALALNCAGLIDVPRGEKASDGEINYIIKHSEPKMIIVGSENVSNRIKFKNKASIDEVEGMVSVQEILNRGKKSTRQLPKVTKDTLATHLYTSGTTGEPKGAELTHGNYVSNFQAVQRHLNLEDGHRALSILPLWHVFERLVELFFIYRGIPIFYSSILSLKKDLAAYKPTIMVIVPRIVEKIFDNAVMKKLQDKSKVEQGVFGALLKLTSLTRRKGWNPFKFLGTLPRQYMEKNVFTKLREGLGGELQLLVSGGGKLRKDIDHFFYSAGIPILEGYGLTETSPVISVRSRENFVLGTVGRPLDNVEVKILDAETGKEKRNGKWGVIFVKGPSIMKGYYKNKYETDKVLRDGWFDTGDLGYIDRGGNLVITGRQKNIIVLSNGENVSPEYIEGALKKCPIITNAIVIGQDWKGLGALIEPDFEILETLVHSSKVDLEDPKVQKLFKRQIREFVSPLSGFREFECIKSFRLLKAPLQPGRELTETLKVKRRVIEKNYVKEIRGIQEDINGK